VPPRDHGDHRTGWPLNDDADQTSCDPDDTDPNDPFGSALARAAERRKSASSSPEHDDDWLSADDPAPEDDEFAAAPVSRRRRLRPAVSDDGWLTGDEAATAGGEPAPPPVTRRRSPVAAPADQRREDQPREDPPREEPPAANGEDPVAVLKRRLAAMNNGSPPAKAKAAPRTRRESGSGSVPAPEAEPAGRRRRKDRDADGTTQRGKRATEPESNPVAKAKDTCLILLTTRARSREELAQALRRKEFEPDVIEQVLGRLDEVGLIDDAAFAEAWVQSRHTYQGIGPRALKIELQRKGVADDVVAEAVAAVDRDAEDQRARELVRKRLRTMSGLDDTVKLRRLVGMLARKGYSQGLAYSVVKDELNAELDPME
jgi:regulatory protein